MSLGLNCLRERASRCKSGIGPLAVARYIYRACIVRVEPQMYTFMCFFLVSLNVYIFNLQLVLTLYLQQGSSHCHGHGW